MTTAPGMMPQDIGALAPCPPLEQPARAGAAAADCPAELLAERVRRGDRDYSTLSALAQEVGRLRQAASSARAAARPERLWPEQQWE